MNSKAVVAFVCLLFLSVLIISSAVSEGNHQEHEKAEVGDHVNPVEESKQRCHHGCCRYYGHRCVKCCGSAAEAQATTQNGGHAEQEAEVEASGYRGGGGKGHGGWVGGGGRGGGGN